MFGMIAGTLCNVGKYKIELMCPLSSGSPCSGWMPDVIIASYCVQEIIESSTVGEGSPGVLKCSVGKKDAGQKRLLENILKYLLQCKFNLVFEIVIRTMQTAHVDTTESVSKF